MSAFEPYPVGGRSTSASNSISGTPDTQEETNTDVGTTDTKSNTGPYQSPSNSKVSLSEVSLSNVLPSNKSPNRIPSATGPVADDTTVEDTTIEGSEACATDKRIQERTEKNEEKGKRRASDGQEETGTEQGGASDGRGMGMGIRHGNWGPESNSLELNQATAALEAVSGADMAMWNNHFGGPSSSERTDENDGPNGYVQDEVRGTKPELDVIENAVAEVYGESRFSPVGQQILAHIYHCQTAKPWQHKEGVPIDHRLIKKACREEGLGEVSATSDVWWPLAQAGYLYYEDYEEGVVTRRFHLASPFIHRLRIAERNGYDTKTRYNLVDGSRKYGKQKTKLTYDGTHSWDQKSEFIYEALEALQGQRDLVNTQAVERHLSRLEVRKGEAHAAYAKVAEAAHKARIEILEEGDELTDEEQERLQKACQPAYEAGRALDRAQGRYDQDLRIWSKIKGQGLEPAEDMPEGICQYETAYEVQEKSGRLTMLVGLQNASEEMKAAACEGIPGYNNVDISSSQTDALIEEMELANEMGADLDVSAVEDMPDKEDVADHFGLGRDAPKTPEHGGKFGAMFSSDTFEEAKDAARGRVFARITGEDGEMDFSKLHRFEFETGEMAYRRAIYNELPTMATVARDWADNDDCKYDDPQKVYQELKEFYEEMTEEIDRWRDWLVDCHWEIAGQNGGDGYCVENPCGLPFDKTAHKSRYDRKAAYATSRLQGREAAYMLSLAVAAEEDTDAGKEGFEYLRNEHDGAAVLGEIPDSARKEARERSGFHRASLEPKPFKGHKDSVGDPAEESQPPEPDSSCNTATPSTTRSRTQSAQSRKEKPSKLPTSQESENTGGGSAGGREGRGGAKSAEMPSGLRRELVGLSASNSATTSTRAEKSGFSTAPRLTPGSKRPSGETTGHTSPEEDMPDGSTSNESTAHINQQQ